MKISAVKGMNIELTEAIKTYVAKRSEGIAKRCSSFEPAAELEVEVGKDTEHHNKGAHYHCRMHLSIPGIMLDADNTEEDLYAAIDATTDDLKRQLKEHKDRALGAHRKPRPDKE